MKILGTIVVVIFAIMLTLGIMAGTKTGFVVIDDTERGTFKTSWNTKYIMTEAEPGPHFFIPGYTTVRVDGIRPILINYSLSEGDKPDTDLIVYEPPLIGKDMKGIPIKLALSIEVRPKAKMLAEMHKDDGDFKTSFYKKVLQANRDAVQDTLSKFSVDTIMAKRTEVETQLKIAIEEDYATNPYFELVKINLKDIVPPKKITDKMLEVQTATLEVNVVAQQVLKSKQEALKKAALASGEAQRLRIEAQGRADSITIEATAQAKANDLISKSLTEKILRNNAIQKWNGVKSRVQAGNSGLIIDLGNVTK